MPQPSPAQSWQGEQSFIFPRSDSHPPVRETVASRDNIKRKKKDLLGADKRAAKCTL